MTKNDSINVKRRFSTILQPMLILAIVSFGTIWECNNHIILKLPLANEITFKKIVVFFSFAVVCLLEIVGIIYSIKIKSRALNIIDSLALNFIPLLIIFTINVWSALFLKNPDGTIVWRMFGNFASRKSAVAALHASMALTVALCLFRTYVRIIRFGRTNGESDKPLIFNSKIKINRFGNIYQFIAVTYNLIFFIAALYSIAARSSERLLIYIMYLVFHLLVTIGFCYAYCKQQKNNTLT